ncbi:hypothetical protein AMTRI_Chr07g23450 [Amborella trichopoda]
MHTSELRCAFAIKLGTKYPSVVFCVVDMHPVKFLVFRFYSGASSWSFCILFQSFFMATIQISGSSALCPQSIEEALISVSFYRFTSTEMEIHCLLIFRLLEGYH